MAPGGHPVMVNLAGFYDDNDTTKRADVLFHELTHVWQAERHILRELFFYDARATLAGEPAYRFQPGNQWRNYTIEKQASIVEAWTVGATFRDANGFGGKRSKFTIGSPLFRYINANVRRADTDRVTSADQSLRALLAEGKHRSVRAMHPQPPTQPWW
jgi:hypothetical protein